MEGFLLLAAFLAMIAAAIFWLGYNTQKARNHKFQTSIRTAYDTLINENRKMHNAPAVLARNKGYSEGYEQGVADSHAAIERLIRNELPDDQPTPDQL